MHDLKTYEAVRAAQTSQNMVYESPSKRADTIPEKQETWRETEHSRQALSTLRIDSNQTVFINSMI